MERCSLPPLTQSTSVCKLTSVGSELPKMTETLRGNNLLDLAHAPFVNMEGERFITYSAAKLQGTANMFCLFGELSCCPCLRTVNDVYLYGVVFLSLYVYFLTQLSHGKNILISARLPLKLNIKRIFDTIREQASDIISLIDACEPSAGTCWINHDVHGTCDFIITQASSEEKENSVTQNPEVCAERTWHYIKTWNKQKCLHLTGALLAHSKSGFDSWLG